VETSLLKTKLNIPPIRPQLVSRPRLTERLKEGLKCNLILISAPAGFGKTTLLSEWSRQSRPNIQTAWVSLDEGDNDPIRFWDYFIAALQTLQPAVGENALTLLHTTQTFPGQIPPIESVLTVLINDLANIRGEFVVALDDYHLIEAQQIHDGITFLLDHLPPQMHLVIATRADPSLPLAHFRGKGMMLEIGADDLRFTLDETVSFFQEMKALGLSTDDVCALNTRTEGWVVGLKMAALSMQRQPDIPEFLTSFTGSQRYVMDYLMEEVLQQQTKEVQEFLLQTSVLNRLTAPLCDAVTERKGSQDILRNLERGHLFIVPLDDSRQWYRYEHLFADILRHQQESTYGAENTAELHRRASQWYEDSNHPDEAIHHALVSRDWQKAAMLITERGKKKNQNGEFSTVANWMQLLPEEVIFSHPELCKLYIVAMQMTGQVDAVESILKTLEEAAQGDESIRDEIAVQQAMAAWRRHDYPLAGKLARKALSILPPDEHENRDVMNLILGWNYNYSGNFREAEPIFAEVYEAFRQSGSNFGAFSAFSGLVSIAWQKGQLRRAAEMCRQAIELAGPSPASVAPHILLSTVLYELNDLEAGVNHIQQVIELGQLIGTMQARVEIHDILACYRLAQGDESGFLEALEKADFEARNIGDKPEIPPGHAARHIQFALKQDDLVAASEWGSKLAEYAGFLPQYLNHGPSRLLIAQGKKSEAAKELQVLYERAAQSEAQGLMIVYRLCQALAAETEEAALEFLTDALTMAEPEGYIRTFVDEGRLLAPLLEKVISRGIKPEYAGKLLRIIEEEQHRKHVRREKGPVKIPYETLSEREMEVLLLLVAGFSNRQIAERLFISVGTVKTHVHNIMAKLEVSGRIQVIARARELNLI